MRLLTFSSLYPNATKPHHGIFVETRLRQLLGTKPIEARVMAPVPWFPFTHERFGDYARQARIPKTEVRHGISIEHPRYPLIPKFGMNLAPWGMALACLPLLRAQIRHGQDFDLIDAHYFYPDGVAATLLGRWLKKPVLITARGSDLNLLPHHPIPRALIQRAARHAAHLITVSGALKQELLHLGVNEHKITVLRNGVDLSLFQPTEREETRKKLGVNGPLLVSVGNLVSGKGHDLVVRALESLPSFHLLIIGSGPEQKTLERLVQERGLTQRVQFKTHIPQVELAKHYSAADALVLASVSEGWANVLLEAMACGTPVVSTAVGGSPELITEPCAGRLVQERTPEALSQAIIDLFSALPHREDTRKFASRFSWDETSEGQMALFQTILSRH
ncbi:glycosyltransferase family 4 protein [Ferrovum myxofaciens]|jgi:glycosyltransferase involved in cell wall biosynthesis|uniref:glycosyltransferase family 4 protein n=1 Tax=Ferrovum myxofaciens TaxID=416213 RepID=UPI0004E0FACC|nr:glycosyltransferase family 4 protein [Ferrovum myxofaciens]